MGGASRRSRGLLFVTGSMGTDNSIRLSVGQVIPPFLIEIRAAPSILLLK